MELRTYFADFHIHLGATRTGKPVKITASKSLSLENVLNHAADMKGLNLIGIIDCHVPEVLEEISQLMERGDIIENCQGGLVYKRKITFLLGSEIEIYDNKCKGPIHVLGLFPTLQVMKHFSEWISTRVTNVHLSSQRIYEQGLTLQRKVKELGGLFIPAHVFTPFKSLYGKGVERSLVEVFDPALIDAIELGLSSNTKMADQIEELHCFPYLSNSDAHSLEKIAREYQSLWMKEPSFQEFSMAIQNKKGRKIESNYGLDPLLGKYHQTTCENCLQKVEINEKSCPNCGHNLFIKGVAARIAELGKETALKDLKRPPYIHQIPLQFIPTLGPKTMQKLREAFQTDMNIIHLVSKTELETVVSTKIAQFIVDARTGNLQLSAGGGGKYGKVNEKT